MGISGVRATLLGRPCRRKRVISAASEDFSQTARVIELAHTGTNTQVHHGSRLSGSCDDGEALSSVHSTALAAGKLIHNLLCDDDRVKNN